MVPYLSNTAAQLDSHGVIWCPLKPNNFNEYFLRKVYFWFNKEC